MKFEYKEFYDISVPISPDLQIYPGDPKIELKPLYSIDSGDKANILELKLGSHTGTHVDVPFHFIKDGKNLDEIPLDTFCGQAKVYELNVEERILKEDLEGLEINRDDIILFKTKNSDLWESREFKENFVYLTLGAAKFLVNKKVKVVGIDYLSIEKYRSKDHLTHQILLESVIILEGINLKNVQPGKYILFFFPLKLKASDGSPVRAILFR